MKRLSVCVFALGLSAMTGSASAADLLFKAPPLPVWSWAGFYVGGNLGYSWGRDATDFTESSTTTSVFTNTTSAGVPLAGNGTTTVTTAAGSGSVAGNMDGWLGGFQAGYNWQRDRWVFGLETDFQWTGEKDDPTFCSPSGCAAGALIGTNATKLPWFGTFRGRVGFSSEPSPEWGPLLLYATGGLAYGRIEESYSMGVVGGPLSAVSVNTTRAGWTVGGGAETRIGHTNWTFKAEYLYMDFGDVTGGIAATGSPVVLPILINSDFRRFITSTTAITGAASTHVTDNIFRIGVNYKWQ